MCALPPQEGMGALHTRAARAATANNPTPTPPRLHILGFKVLDDPLNKRTFAIRARAFDVKAPERERGARFKRNPHAL